ncbi:MAG: DNA recombination protein RmuC, partial [Gaiellaceae bacterium]
AAAAQMIERAADLAKLEQALRPPKARGGFGELLLENLLRDRLPPTAFEMQYTFDSGERVDALVRVDRSIPIDSKFPLDNYNRLVEAETDDERALAERQFSRDVKQHIDAIAAKYIRPDEGTYDFAFMYIPVEAVYYELACGKTGALLGYANERRVFPVSPTTFTAYLQVIALGLRGLQIEQHAHEVMAYVADLQRDFNRFADDFDKVGTHIQHAQSKYHEASKRLDRFETKLERAVEEHEELESETVLELPGVAADAA